MNTKISKIVSILILIIILLTNLSPVFALSFDAGQKITLEKDHDCISLLKVQGKDLLKGITYVVYKDTITGKKQPAFCVEPEQEGVGTGAGDSYDVTLDLLNDQKLWRVLYKGYMGSSYANWGLECSDDLYYATKVAIHCLCDGSTPKGKYEVPTRVGWGEDISLAEVQRRGAKVLEVAQQLYDYGIYGTENYITPQISATEAGNATIQTINGIEYFVQNYVVNGNRDITTYNISISNFPSNTIILDNSNVKTSTMFNSTFKIAIPTKNITENVTGIINITNAQVKTYPVFFAKAYIEDVQDYIIYADPVEFTNTSTILNIDAYKSGLKITKVDEETGEKLSGVTFNIKYTADNKNIGDFTTSSQGTIEIKGLHQGQITITEKSTKDEYILNTTPINATLEYDDMEQIIVDNSHKKGNIKVIKIDKDNNAIRIPNVEFQLLDSSKQVVETYTTDRNGEIYISNLRTGNYYLRETKQYENYYPLEKDVQVIVDYNKTTEIKIQNEKMKGQIRINKVDEDYNEIPVKNAEFEIINSDGEVVESIKTDANGKAITSKLPIGTYKIHEITTNEDYILDEQNKYVEIKKDMVTDITLTNKHKYGNVKVFKVDKDNNKIALGGVEFYLYSEEFEEIIGQYTTNSNGEFFVENLRTGRYKLIEKNTNKWYDLTEDTEIKVEWDTTINTIIENELKKGQVKVIKIDMDNNEIKLEGVKFKVLDEKGNVLEEIVTDKNGEATTSKYSVRDYEKLILKEVETQEGYHLNEEPVIVTLEAHQIKNVTIENEVKKGKIKVIKIDKDNNEVLIEGVTFNIIDEQGNIVDTITTNGSGEATTKKLPISQQYKVIEVETREEYVLSDEIQTITLQEDEITTIKFENELKKGQIKIIKIDSDNNEILLKGVTFDILDESNNVVDTIVTDENGEALSKRLPITHTYTAIERETRQEYVLAEETQTAILEQEQITTLIFKNEKKKGYIQITKVNEENPNEKLSGAEFEIFDKENNLVDIIKIGEAGIGTSNKLIVGKYTIKESKTGSAYYLLNEDTFEVEIAENEQIVPITISNKKVDIEVDVEKTGTIEITPEDDVEYIFSNISNLSNVYLEEFKWFDYIPTDYVRLEKMTTGTWNQNLAYNVYYKTNKSEDYILFKEGLKTDENYDLDFTILKLSEDEYITETMFDFGKVNTGFKESTNPTMKCKSFNTLQNNVTFTNCTRTTGIYFGITAEANNNWTTLVHIPEKMVEIKLPRTGK